MTRWNALMGRLQRADYARGASRSVDGVGGTHAASILLQRRIGVMIFFLMLALVLGVAAIAVTVLLSPLVAGDGFADVGQDGAFLAEAGAICSRADAWSPEFGECRWVQGCRSTSSYWSAGLWRQLVADRRVATKRPSWSMALAATMARRHAPGFCAARVCLRCSVDVGYQAEDRPGAAQVGVVHALIAGLLLRLGHAIEHVAPDMLGRYGRPGQRYRRPYRCWRGLLRHPWSSGSRGGRRCSRP